MTAKPVLTSKGVRVDDEIASSVLESTHNLVFWALRKHGGFVGASTVAASVWKAAGNRPAGISMLSSVSVSEALMQAAARGEVRAKLTSGGVLCFRLPAKNGRAGLRRPGNGRG